MPKEYRSRAQVVHELLRAIQSRGPIGVTRLTAEVNLTHTRIQEHLATFESNGLIAAQAEGDRRAWVLTPRGHQALDELRRIDRAMADFGIGL